MSLFGNNREAQRAGDAVPENVNLKNQAMSHITQKDVADGARRTLLEGSGAMSERNAVAALQNVARKDPRVLEPQFVRGLFEALRDMVDNPTVDQDMRLAAVEIVSRVSPAYMQIMLVGMLNSKGNGSFAAYALARLSQGEGALDRPQLVALVESGQGRSLQELGSGSTEHIKERARVRLSHQATFMALTGSDEARQYLEDLFVHDDYNLRMHVLEELSGMGERAVKSLSVLGELEQTLRRGSEDASDVAEKIRDVMRCIATDFAALPRDAREELLPFPMLQSLHHWTVQAQMGEIAALLEPLVREDL